MAATKKEKKLDESGKDEAAEEKETAAADDPSDSDTESGEGGAKKKFKLKLSGRNLVFFVVLPLVVLAALGAGAFALGLVGGGAEDVADGHGAAQEGGHGAAAGEAVFFDLPEMLVNIQTRDQKQTFLKISMSLELKSAADSAAVEAAMPRLVDGVQVFLRELRLEDLNGSAAVLRLREELARRVNVAVAPVTVRDVLFKEIIVQ